MDERLPEVPLVKVLPEIGRYGGTAYTFGWNTCAFMLEIGEGGRIGPGVARDYEQSVSLTLFPLPVRGR